MSRADDESKAVDASDVVVATPVDLQPKADIEHGNPSYDTPTKEAIEVANVVKEGNDSSPAKKATLGELLQFADSTDTCLMGTGFCMAIISGLNQPAQLIIFGSILDSFNGSTRSSSIKMVSFLALMYLIVAIQMFITNCLQTACMSATSGRQVKRMRDVYFRSLLRQHIAYFDANDQGALATSVMERTLVIQDGLGEKLALGVQFFVSFIAGIAVAFYYVWQLALLMLGVIPVFIILIGIAVSQLQKSSEDSTNAYTRAGSTAQQALGAIRTLFALGGEQRAANTYKAQLVDAESAGLRRWFAMGAMIGTVSCIMWMMYALGLWFGAWLISRDMEKYHYCNYYMYFTDSGEAKLHVPESRCITGGNIMICFFSIIFGGLNLGQAFPSIGAVQSALVEFQKMLDVIRNESPIDPTSTDGEVPSGDVQGAIELRDVSFAYPMRSEHLVYNGMNIKIEAGQTVAFVGPSGCGKSTCVSLIERFYDPSSGAVLLDGRDLRTLRVSWLRKQIGLVSQEPVLFSGTIYDNIVYGREGATREDVENAARMANAHAFISAFPDGYDTEVGEKGIQLSGGQKQRVAIARAIVRDPKILILDEATSALDTTSERVVQEALDNLLKAKKRTTIVIAHRLSTIRNADRILVFDHGVVVEEGTHDELINREKSLYATLVKMQMSSIETDSHTSTTKDPIPASSTSGDATTAAAVTVDASEVTEEQLAAAVALHEKKLHPEKHVGDHHDIEQGIQKKHQNAPSPSTEKTKDAAVAKAIAATEDEVEEKTSSVAWIWALSAPERPYLYVGLMGSVLVGAAFPLLGYLLAEMIKVFYNADPVEMRHRASYWAYIFLGIAGSQLIGAFTAQYCFGVITERLACRVREKSFTKMLQMDVAWYDLPHNTAGSLAQQLATDCVMIKALTGERASTSTAQIVTISVSLAIAFYHCWEMTLLMLGLFPLIGAAFGVQHAFVKSAAGAAMDATNEAGSVASETLLNIRTVNAFSLENFSAVQFEKHLVKPLAQFIRKGIVTGAGMGFGQFVILAGAGLAYYVGGQLVLMERTTFPAVMAVILSIMFGAVGLGQFAADASDKAEAMVAAKKIQKLWNAKTKIYALNNEQGVIPSATNGEIVFEDVCFAYPMRSERNVYNHINIKVEAGQTVAFVGPSGCGKSTAVSLIERFYDPASGRVLLDGTDVRTIQLSWLRQQIGLVSQEPVLFSGTIFENIAYGKEGATREDVENAARMANAHDFITALSSGYDTMVGEKGIQLSGGQKQRVAIARAIVRDPKILILDEATSALDTTSERVVQEALDNLLKAKKRTTIVIAHRLSTIRNADKIIVLMDGVVVEEGTHDELMLSVSGHYRDLVKNSQHEKA